jgi:hypothetical protein
MFAQIAVPAEIVLLRLSSLSAQVARVWPNFPSEQKAADDEEKSENQLSAGWDEFVTARASFACRLSVLWLCRFDAGLINCAKA